MQRFSAVILFTTLFSFSAQSQSYADCITARDICEKTKLRINSAGGEGSNRSEADFIACFMNSENNGQAEENSTWIKFEIAESGTLTFTITPHKQDDDIDFVLYRSLDGSCNNLKILRCNAAGDPSDLSSHSKCLGQTGLRSGETDSSEDAGCQDPNDNAWLAPVNALKGEKYYLLVSNVTTKGPGFDVVFGGTCMMPCEKKKPVVAVTPPVKPPVKPAKPPVVVAAKSTTAPQTIGGRKVEVKKEVVVKTRKIKLTIWDSQVQDGDIISIYVDDKKAIDRIYLTQQKQDFDLELPIGSEHYLTVFAEDFGKSGGVNTAKVTINDGVNEQTIDLAASHSSQQSVKIVKQ